jgi:hypothetical protein
MREDINDTIARLVVMIAPRVTNACFVALQRNPPGDHDYEQMWHTDKILLSFCAGNKPFRCNTEKPRSQALSKPQNLCVQFNRSQPLPYAMPTTHPRSAEGGA